MSKPILFQPFHFTKTVPFQTIQFSICTQFKCKIKCYFKHISLNAQFRPIWSIDRNLSSATSPRQSWPGSDGNEGVLRIPQSSSITETSPSVRLVSYPGHTFGVSYPSAVKQSVYSTARIDLAARHLLRVSYPSAEKQSVYSIARIDWAATHSLGVSYLSCREPISLLRHSFVGFLPLCWEAVVVLNSPSRLGIYIAVVYNFMFKVFLLFYIVLLLWPSSAFLRWSIFIILI